MIKVIKSFIGIILFTAAATASACSFGPDADIMKSAEENFKNKNVAVLLKIEAITGNSDTAFSVEKYYKGSGSTDDFTLINPGHSCALTFAQEYVSDYILVFANSSADIKNMSQGTPYKRFETVAEADSFVSNSSVVVSKPLPESPIACTMEYAPVCGQQSIQCVKAPCPQPEPKTYSNSCMAGVDGARVLYKGECEMSDKPTEPVFCTSDAMQCEDGSWVGRTGPNCEFMCPSSPKVAPANCKLWFDGCNSCSRGQEGGLLACTKKACAVNETPVCKEFFVSGEVEVEIDFGSEPTGPPEEGFMEPTTPPPSETEELSKKQNVFVKVWIWFKGLFN